MNKMFQNKKTNAVAREYQAEGKRLHTIEVKTDDIPEKLGVIINSLNF